MNMHTSEFSDDSLRTGLGKYLKVNKKNSVLKETEPNVGTVNKIVMQIQSLLLFSPIAIIFSKSS